MGWKRQGSRVEGRRRTHQERAKGEGGEGAAAGGEGGAEAEVAGDAGRRGRG